MPDDMKDMKKDQGQNPGQSGQQPGQPQQQQDDPSKKESYSGPYSRAG
jgi:hypothetical protein